jgi:hypothetical protein
MPHTPTKAGLVGGRCNFVCQAGILDSKNARVLPCSDPANPQASHFRQPEARRTLSIIRCLALP